ncbi:hypothetical protein WN51_07669 [Melipona quadrifasciata]|uniref:Uncharacterized protein n=1 Tax=Melipona quadrifasciata TaxID=166423 RepID=A0A0M8ZQC4_9HYME|nr:hypothetical protein WN51_07669 [Melipona quadrifasciata]
MTLLNGANVFPLKKKKEKKRRRRMDIEKAERKIRILNDTIDQLQKSGGSKIKSIDRFNFII